MMSFSGTKKKNKILQIKNFKVFVFSHSHRGCDDRKITFCFPDLWVVEYI